MLCAECTIDWTFSNPFPRCALTHSSWLSIDHFFVIPISGNVTSRRYSSYREDFCRDVQRNATQGLENTNRDTQTSCCCAWQDSCRSPNFVLIVHAAPGYANPSPVDAVSGWHHELGDATQSATKKEKVKLSRRRTPCALQPLYAYLS